MSTAAMEPKTTYEISITRTFDAPQELVWKAWTDPEMAKEWMGPRGFTTTEFTTSSEPGSPWHLTMKGERPGSAEIVTLGQGGRILEVRPPELLVYTFGWDSRASVGLGDGPKEKVITIRFEELMRKDGHVHFHQAPFATESERDGHNGGWNSASGIASQSLVAAHPAGATRDRGRAFPEASCICGGSCRRLDRSVFDAWTKPGDG